MTANPTAPNEVGAGEEATAFSARIREASWSRHQGLDPTAAEAADRVPGVFDRLFDGSLSLDDYTEWHAQQYFIYDAIETAAERWRGDDVAGAFVFDELARRGAIEADLEFLIGPDWRERIEPLDATLRYAERISAVANDWAGGYIAHSYTRYLGDLSGGQAFGKAARQNYDLDDAGAGFYSFDGIDSPKRFKDDYRARLDAVALEEADRLRVIEEILLAYDYNGEVLKALADKMNENPFSDDVIAAICKHMNTDHASDTLVMCQGAGDRPEATEASMTGLDAHGGDYVVVVDGEAETIRIPWARKLSERAEVRPEVVRIFTESQAQLSGA
ncbi:biliverdin-producing heme oxygenase [Glycomyces buryatensis]|uniref:DUF2470 domain-containing protein n=1 Tax=Glycomyces buryatensis TaxID=2570927 RepID=A0A4S8QCN8_9ACTN|nr:biliverdin-producing heme oxygenase [Glycomyces buryatensis]THV42297.1 DUF2470 domain-containing protein [Glycomyces buryatensis]